MTDLLTRPPASASSAPTRSVVLSATESAAMAAGFGLVAVALVVVLAWAADGRSGSGAGAALRTAAQIWLLAQHASLQLPSGHLGLVPLGLTALPIVLLVRAGRTVAGTGAVASVRTACTAACALAGSYGVLVALVTGLAATSSVRPAPLQALAGGFVLALVAGGAGIGRAAGLRDAGWQRLPAEARRLVTAGTAAIAVLLGAGAVLAATALAVHAGRAGELARATSPGAAGGLALLLACVAYLPTAAVWGAAYVVGPGFAVGAGTAVAPAGISLGALPAFPLLAALPNSGSAPLVSLPLLLAPVAAGAAAGWVLCRQQPAASVRRAALRGLGCGPLAGVAMAVLSWLADGPAGPGRFATVGPSAWQVGLAAAAEIGLAGAATATCLVWWRSRRPPAATP